MIKEGLFRQYQEIAEFYKFDAGELSDIVLAVVLSDFFSGTNRQGLDLERFLSVDRGLREFLGYPEMKRQCRPLPDVQTLRILCDSLVIASAKAGKRIDGAHLTSEASGRACSANGIKLRSGGYSKEDECYRVFDILILSRLVDTFSSRILYPMLLLSGNHSIAVV